DLVLVDLRAGDVLLLEECPAVLGALVGPARLGLGLLDGDLALAALVRPLALAPLLQVLLGVVELELLDVALELGRVEAREDLAGRHLGALLDEEGQLGRAVGAGRDLAAVLGDELAVLGQRDHEVAAHRGEDGLLAAGDRLGLALAAPGPGQSARPGQQRHADEQRAQSHVAHDPSSRMTRTPMALSSRSREERCCASRRMRSFWARASEARASSRSRLSTSP